MFRFQFFYKLFSNSIVSNRRNDRYIRTQPTGPYRSIERRATELGLLLFYIVVSREVADKGNVHK